MKKHITRVLFVCTGNICRSPSAEGAFRKIVEAEGLSGEISTDSAGTHGYHVNEAPDPRTQHAALERGIDLSLQRARKVVPQDFEMFDYIIAMDRSNHRILSRMCPPDARPHLYMMMDFSPDSEITEVPDPYYGGERGFEEVLDLVQDASLHLLAEIQHTHLKH